VAVGQSAVRAGCTVLCAATVLLGHCENQPIGLVCFSTLLNKFKSVAKFKNLFKFDLKSENYEITFYE
jgi:hypothetical protein